MRVVKHPAGLRRIVRGWRAEGQRVVFVPTMGYFHDGHLSLMRQARRRGDRVVVSIFVNPTQFAPTEDLAAYPRDLPRDLALARGVGVDLCFVPAAERIYRPGRCTEGHVTGLESRLEGATRPTHFAGVALVVLKLLHLVEPDIMILGQKDAQQAVILERMVEDLDLPVKMVRGATRRERDGLAMSSRNVYLSPEDRRAAPVLHRALAKAERAARGGERSAAKLVSLIRREVAAEPRARLDYTAVVNAHTLESLDRVEGRVLIPIAAYLGRTRLIDNVEFQATRRSR
jgi:pantoate--beta-alanine ligase